MVKCPECGSQRTWKDGKRYAKEGEIQRYLCRSCGYRFSQPKVKVNVAGKRFENSNPRNKNSHGMVLGSDSPIQKASDDLSLPSCEDVGSHVTPHASTVEKTLNSLCLYNRERRVSVSKREAKNLVKVETRKKQAAGATKQAEVKGKIVEYAWHRKKQGRLQTTIHTDVRSLTSLLQAGADLFNPESVKEILALNEKWKPNTKALFTSVYSCFLNFLGLTWQKPNYKPQRKLPFIPTEKEIDTLIAGCGKKTAAILQLLKETGCRVGEALQVEWTDINITSQTLTINAPEKNGNPRILKVSTKLLSMLNNLKRKDSKIFGKTTTKTATLCLSRTRKKVARKLQNPRLLKITFHTLRHWKATMEYHKTKDILHVKQLLGHRKIDSTMIYINLESALFYTENNEFHVKTAKTQEEIKGLLEVGFEYVCEKDNLIYFRKRK